MLEYDKVLIGKRIATIRKQKGLTQEKLSEIIDLNDKSVSNIENGNTGCSIETVFALCNALDITIEYLLTGRITYEMGIQTKSENINARINMLTPEKYVIFEDIADLSLTALEL